MRVFHVQPDQFAELEDLPQELPATGFIWIGSGRREFEVRHADLQSALQRWVAGQIVDLHVSDLLNQHLPSHFDYTSWYDMLVFRRLAAGAGSEVLAHGESLGTALSAREALASIDTSPVGFAVFDRVLITVHPTDCAVRDYFAVRLAGLAGGSEARGMARLPSSPADLMLRMVNHMVDGYLDLRRLLTRQLGALQQQLLDPKNRFADWQVLLDSRNTLHTLEDICEDQRSALQEWIDALEDWPVPTDPMDASRIAAATGTRRGSGICPSTASATGNLWVGRPLRHAPTPTANPAAASSVGLFRWCRPHRWAAMPRCAARGTNRCSGP